MSRCSFCTRQAEHEFETIRLCESCGKAFREGFEHGKVYESIRRRKEASWRKRK